MTITLTIPDAVSQRVIDALSIGRGWAASNALTKAQFAKAQIVAFTKDATKFYEASRAASQAQQTAAAAVDTDILIT